MANEDALDRIDRGINALRVEYERYFSGAIRFPPEDLRTKLQQEFRLLRNTNITSAADNFRLGTLEARFNTYNELLNRRLREREEGRPAVAHEPPPPRFDATTGITLGATPDSAAVEALFVGMYRNASGARVDLESFRSYLAQQITGIRQKTGCGAVQFRVAIEDGKPRLKAKPIADPS